jgi:hypothetical protein
MAVERVTGRPLGVEKRIEKEPKETMELSFPFFFPVSLFI